MEIGKLYQTNRLIANPAYDGRARKGFRSRRFIAEGTRFFFHHNLHGIVFQSTFFIDGVVLHETRCSSLPMELYPISEEVEPQTYDEIMITLDPYYDCPDDSYAAGALQIMLDRGDMAPSILRKILTEVVETSREL